MKPVRVLVQVLLSSSLVVLAAYYLYKPLPAGLQEPWKLLLLDAGFRTTLHLVRSRRSAWDSNPQPADQHRFCNQIRSNSAAGMTNKQTAAAL